MSARGRPGGSLKYGPHNNAMYPGLSDSSHRGKHCPPQFCPSGPPGADGMVLYPNPGVGQYPPRGFRFDRTRRRYHRRFNERPPYAGNYRTRCYDGTPRLPTQGEIDCQIRLCCSCFTLGIFEILRLCCCRNFGKYPPPDVDPATGYPVGMVPPGQPMEQPMGLHMGQPVVMSVAQPYAPAQTPESNGTVYQPSYSVTPQSMAADDNQPKYGYDNQPKYGYSS